MQDTRGREYAKLSDLKPGDRVQVDDGFEGCFLPWSILQVVEEKGELGLYHNAPESAGGHEADCLHMLEGQLSDEEEDYLIGIYKMSSS